MNSLLQRAVLTVIDSEGFRPNVGIILFNADRRLFWAKRIGQRSWQFPQGGIRRDESPEQAMFRELAEEVGLRPEHVQVLGCTKGWLRYRLPKRLIRHSGKPTCIGQKQVWFLLRMLGSEDEVRLDLSERPEFDHWEWVDYWYPLRAVVSFKRHVYWRALHELAPLLSLGGHRKLLPSRRENPESAAYNQDSRGPLSSRQPTLIHAHTSAIVAVTTAQPIRPPDQPSPPTVLPLRRVETHQHPVITRMVISARIGKGDPAALVAATALEPAVTQVLDPASRPAAPRSRRFFRR